MKAAKTLVLVVTTIIGYFMGVHWIGPAFVGRPAVATALPAEVHDADAAPTAPAAPVAVPTNGADGSSEPVAVVSDRRHHRTDAALGPDGTPEQPRHRRRHVKTAPNPDETAGDTTAVTSDHSVLPVDAANVSGADNQPAGTDPTHMPTTGDEHPGDNAAPPANNGDGASGNSGATPDTPPAPGVRHRRRPSDNPPADPGAAPGDNPPAGDAGGAGDTRPTSTSRGTPSQLASHRWTAVGSLPPVGPASS